MGEFSLYHLKSDIYYFENVNGLITPDYSVYICDESDTLCRIVSIVDDHEYFPSDCYVVYKEELVPLSEKENEELTDYFQFRIESMDDRVIRFWLRGELYVRNVDLRLSKPVGTEVYFPSGRNSLCEKIGILRAVKDDLAYMRDHHFMERYVIELEDGTFIEAERYEISDDSNSIERIRKKRKLVSASYD